MGNVNIRVNAVGAQAINGLNAMLGQYAQNIKNITMGQNQWNATFSVTQAQLRQVQGELQKNVLALNEIDKGTKRHSLSMVEMVANYTRFKVVSTVWNEVAQSVREATKAVVDYDFQAARATRATGVSGRGTNYAAVREGAGVLGDIGGAGESYYQLSTHIQDANAKMSTFRDTMKLLVGTESDARETTRLVIQLYRQFGDTMSDVGGDTGKLSAITELIATMFKDANAEVGELAQSLKYLGPIAVAAKVPLEQVAAIVTALTAEGHRGRMQGTEASALLTNIIKNYDAEVGGIKKGDMVAQFKKYKDANGNFDLVSTIKGVISNAQEVAKTQGSDAGEKYLQLISGTQASFRLQGALEGKSMLALIDTEAKRANDAVKGLSHNLDDIHKIMESTFAQTTKETWTNFIGAISDALAGLAKQLGVIKGLSTFNEMMQYNNTKNTNAQVIDQNARASSKGYVGTGIMGLTSMLGSSGQLFKNVNMTTEEAMRQALRPSTATGTGIWALDGADAYNKDLVSGTQFDIAMTMLKTAYPNQSGYTKEQIQATLDRAGQIYRSQPATANWMFSKHGGTGMPKPIKNAYHGTPPDPDDVKKSRIRAIKDELAVLDVQFEVMSASPWNVDSGALSSIVNRYNSLQNELAGLEGRETGATRLRQSLGISDAQMRAKDIRRGGLEESLTSQQTSYNLLMDSAKESPMEYYYPATMLRAQSIDDRMAAIAKSPAEKDAIKRMGAVYKLNKLRRQHLDDALSIPGNLAWSFDTSAFIVGQYGRDELERGYSARPNTLWGGSYEGQYAQISTAREAASTTLGRLRRSGPGIPVEQIQEFDAKVKSLDASLRNLVDSHNLTRFREQIEDIHDSASQQRFELGLGGGRLYGESPEAYNRRRLQMLQSEVGIASAEHGNLAARYGLESAFIGVPAEEQRRRTKELQSTSNAVKDAEKNFKDFANDLANAKRDAVLGKVSDTVYSGILDIYHGHGSALQTAGNVGNIIVENAITNFVKPFFDPLIGSITNQILAINTNTEALYATAYGGVGGIDEAAAAGAGAAAGGTARQSKQGTKTPTMSNIGMGLAAYSVFQNGQQSGNWLSGGLGGVLAGASMGLGPVGMAVGGVIGLIGGLFGGKKKDPLAEDKARNPAFYNSPEDFVYNAYRYRATGQLPNSMNGYVDWRTNAPVVNVYVDGVKSAVRTEMGTSLGLGNVAHTNTYMDYHGPQ